MKGVNIKIIFLGTAGYLPTEDRHTNCVLIKDLNIILDAGSGFFRFVNFIDPVELHIFLSHFHMDHIDGLVQLLGLLRGKRAKKVEIYGYRGVRPAIGNLFNPPYFPVPIEEHPFEIDFKEVGNRAFDIGETNVATKVFAHSNPPFSVGYRIEHRGKVISFVTDTAVSEEEESFVRNSDLLIHEAYYPKGYRELAKHYHSITVDVANLAKATNCKRLALFHFNRNFDPNLFTNEIRGVFPNSFLPDDLAEIEL